MNVSAFDLFKIGIGPSSSHTVGPMIAASRFAARLVRTGALAAARVRVELYGAGRDRQGHGTDKAVMLGLEGCLPDRIDPDEVEPRLARIRQGCAWRLPGPTSSISRKRRICSISAACWARSRPARIPMACGSLAVDGQGGPLAEGIYYSIGGGFVVDGQGGKGTTPLRPPACRIRFAPAPTWRLPRKRAVHRPGGAAQ